MSQETAADPQSGPRPTSGDGGADLPSDGERTIGKRTTGRDRGPSHEGSAQRRPPWRAGCACGTASVFPSPSATVHAVPPPGTLYHRRGWRHGPSHPPGLNGHCFGCTRANQTRLAKSSFQVTALGSAAGMRLGRYAVPIVLSPVQFNSARVSGDRHQSRPGAFVAAHRQ